MQKREQQSKVKSRDRLLVNVTEEVGNRIREEASQKGLAISNYLAQIIDAYWKEENVPPPSEQEKEADEPQVEIRKPNCNEVFEESVKILEAAGKAEKMITASRVWQEKAKINEYCRKIFFPAFRDRVIALAFDEEVENQKCKMH